MTEKRTEIKPELPYWAICYGTHTVNHDNEDELEEDGSYSSDMTSKYWLVEFDSATELDEYLGNSSVSAGESMGEYTFDVVRLYTSWEMHNWNLEDENASKEEEEPVEQDMYGRICEEEEE